MVVAILGRSKWEWGKGDVVVIRVDESYFAQAEEREDEYEADEITPALAMDLLTRHSVRLTDAGCVWMREQRELWAKYEMAEGRKRG